MDVRSDGPVTVADTEVLRLASQHVDQEFQLWVARPRAGLMNPLPERYGVLWVLDGDLFFSTAVDMTRLMHQLYGEIPPLLVVGVSYGVDPATQGELRSRDLTPSADPSFEEMGRAMRPGWEPLLPEGSRTGRAADFLRFLTEEARPAVEARYPVAGQRHVLFGSSLGGLFASWVLQAAPDSFSDYVAASPALWWGGEEVLSMAGPQGAEGTPAEAPERGSPGVFLGVGALEEVAGVAWAERFKLVTNTRALARRLEERRGPAAPVHLQVLEGETHTSVVPVVLTRGLRALLGAR